LFPRIVPLVVAAVDDDGDTTKEEEGGIMDAHKAGEDKGAAGEVRRINVVYFLSRGGRTDHPHLFRVNHRSRAGVRLRGTCPSACLPVLDHLAANPSASINAHRRSMRLIAPFAFGSIRSDVKRWLSELRGKDMPDNYSWSYKRYGDRVDDP